MLVLCTHVAPLYIIADVYGHVQPPIDSLDQLQSSLLAKVAGDGGVVVQSQDLVFEYVIGDVDLLISIWKSALEHNSLRQLGERNGFADLLLY